jgi:hypothetical protein
MTVEYGSTRRVKSDSEAFRDEMRRRVTKTARRVCSDPKLLEDYHILLDESTLTKPEECGQVDLAQMCYGSEDVPAVHAQTYFIGRHSARIRALEQLQVPPARVQPRESGISAVLQALEREVCRSEKDYNCAPTAN